MATQPEIAVPTTSTSTTPKPHTVYNITLRLPLRTFTLQKRYSDFTTLHTSLISQAGASPPVSLPPKFYFSNTFSSPALAESRRIGLQTYLQSLNTDSDDRWRNTSAWRSFLNLPSNSNSTHSNRHNPLNRTQQQQQPITDPVVWLDYHRDLKSQLHSARLQLTKRDQAASGQAQHECSAEAKRHLIKAGSMITALDSGLKTLANDTWGRDKLGDGEMRRRRDLVSAAQKEREGLENLGNAMVAKHALDGAIAHATQGDKDKLLAAGGAHGDDNNNNGLRRPATATASKGRVLGKESDRTRALDNQGVLQLQQQLMQEQDEDVDVLAAAVARQKKIGIEIQEELVLQEGLLGMLDEDVDRVQGKIDVARKRIGKIS
ncbi:MAG: hypothetical protein Q9168_001990 [Polycauliona sp. 1 TL-2023]